MPLSEADMDILNTIQASQDRTEQKTMAGNHMTGMVISSVTIGKKVTFGYDSRGGEISANLGDI